MAKKQIDRYHRDRDTELEDQKRRSNYKRYCVCPVIQNSSSLYALKLRFRKIQIGNISNFLGISSLVSAYPVDKADWKNRGGTESNKNQSINQMNYALKWESYRFDNDGECPRKEKRSRMLTHFLKVYLKGCKHFFLTIRK